MSQVQQTKTPDAKITMFLVDHAILSKQLKAYTVGKKIRITDKKFNGQTHGCSKPSLLGKTFIIRDAFFWAGSVTVWLEGNNYAVGLDQFEFVEEGL